MPFKREGSDIWYIRVNGLRKSSGTTDLEQAKALEAKLNHQTWLEKHMGVKPPKSWQDAVARRAKEGQAKGTWHEEKTKLRWWHQFLGGIDDLNKITREMIDEIIQRERPVDPAKPCPENATGNKYVNVVAKILNDAERVWGWSSRAPVLRHYPAMPPKDICPMPEEVLKLIRELPEHSADIALYAAATMHRRANITGLTWSQIDWEKQAVRIAGQFAKTGKPIYVPLNRTAMGVLEKRRQMQVRHMTHVFWYRKHLGHMQYKVEPIIQVTTAAWNKAVKRAGLPKGVTLHTMRHCANSWLAQRGVPREIRARLGGWSVGSSAIDGYTHLYIDDLRPYVALLDELLLPATQFRHSEVGRATDSDDTVALSA